MTKSELIEALALRQPHLKPEDVELAVKSLLEMMSDSLTTGQRIEVRADRAGPGRVRSEDAAVLRARLRHELALPAPGADLQQLKAKDVVQRVGAKPRLEPGDDGSKLCFEPGRLTRRVHRFLRHRRRLRILAKNVRHIMEFSAVTRSNTRARAHARRGDGGRRCSK